AVEDADNRTAAETGGGDNVGDAVAIHVSSGHAHAAGEGGLVSVEIGDVAPTDEIEDADGRPAAGIGAGDEITHALPRHDVDVVEGWARGDWSETHSTADARSARIAVGQEVGLAGAVRQNLAEVVTGRHIVVVQDDVGDHVVGRHAAEI